VSEERETAAVLDRTKLDAIEAILFVAGEPVLARDLAAALGEATEREVVALVEYLRSEYERRAGALAIERVAGGFQMCTRPEVGPRLRAFFRARNRTRLSAAALETLAIVAYRQPVTAPEIQALRGVDSSASLRTLLEKKLIRIVGRKKVVGTPLLYGTTRQFLAHFGLNRLEELPSVEEFQGLWGEKVWPLGSSSASADGEPASGREIGSDPLEPGQP